MASSSPKTQRTSRIILAVVGVLVLSALGYFASQYFRTKEESIGHVERINSLTAEVLDLEQEIRTFELEMKEKNLTLEDRERDLILMEQKRQALLQKIDAVTEAKDADIERLRRQLSGMRVELQANEELVRKLRRRYDSLASEMDLMQDSLITLTGENISAKDLLARNQERTEQVIEAASVLQVADFDFIHVTKRGKEKDLRESKTRNIHKLKTCVKVLGNPVATPGTRTFYLMLEGPDKKLITNEAGGYSGDFQVHKTTRTYSTKLAVDFQGTSQVICFEFQPEEDYKFDRGDQIIRVYDAQGNMIGADSFKI